MLQVKLQYKILYFMMIFNNSIIISKYTCSNIHFMIIILFTRFDLSILDILEVNLMLCMDISFLLRQVKRLLMFSNVNS